MSHYFVTGTDTEVGKTFISSALLVRARQRGLATAALKPVAAGAVQTPEGLRNDDAEALAAVITQPMTYPQLNPVCLPPAIAPHIAAEECGVTLSVAGLAAQAGDFLALNSDFGLVEGAGGWLVPLNDQETLADLARVLGFPVILVVAMRLGCINHGLLTARAIAADGLPLAGWVANSPQPQPMARYQQNLATLQQRMPAPLLGEVGFCPEGDLARAAARLRLPTELE